MTTTFANNPNQKEVDQLQREVEEILSGHRVGVVNKVLEQIKLKVSNQAVFKREIDK